MDVRLFIKRIHARHFQSYGISATNALGKTSRHIELVQSKPQVYFQRIRRPAQIGLVFTSQHCSAVKHGILCCTCIVILLRCSTVRLTHCWPENGWTYQLGCQISRILREIPNFRPLHPPPEGKAPGKTNLPCSVSQIVASLRRHCDTWKLRVKLL